MKIQEVAAINEYFGWFSANHEPITYAVLCLPLIALSLNEPHMSLVFFTLELSMSQSTMMAESSRSGWCINRGTFMCDVLLGQGGVVLPSALEIHFELSIVSLQRVDFVFCL